ncbi:MAG: DUF6880 family protein, partial [Cyanobacteria bacterium J06648_11]
RALQNAIPIGDFVDYYAADGYAEEVQQAIDGLETLMGMGYASDVVELCEDAIAMLDRALNSIDDSNGNMYSIIEQVQDLHLRACQVAKPNPSALAERLLDIELESGFGFFDNALETYADVLGEAGLEAYRQLVDAAWKRLSSIGSEGQMYYDFRRMKLNELKEAFVRSTGTLEELVETIATDLSRPDRYLKIAELYRDNKDLDEAIAWAQRGMETFAGSNQTYGLSQCLIEIYERQQRYEEATAIAWERFERRPSLPEYQRLQEQAELGGTWQQWRDRAIAFIRAAYDRPAEFGDRYFGHRGYSLLANIYMWENDPEAAWKTAQAGGCSQTLWLKLADARAADAPEDSLSVYRAAIAPLIQQTKNEAYAQAVEILEKVRDIMQRLDRGPEFNAYAEKLGNEYKRKRNFIKLLEARGMY